MGAVEKIPLFSRPTEWITLFLAFFLLFALNLLYHYHQYRNFSKHPFLKRDATVLNQYEKLNKKGRPYTVLKLQSGGLTFYTTSREELKPLKGRDISLTLITKSVPFHRYLSTFYAPSFNLELLPKSSSFKAETIARVTGQHDDPVAANLYAALFFAEPVGKKLRDHISDFGISHLIALSGYHLGFLGGILWLLFRWPYTFFQQRFFPYRNRRFDLAFLSALILLGYMLFTGTPPSLLRAYGMLAVGLFLFTRWIDLFSFGTLALSIALLVALVPSLLFSVGFWFSVAGVFYIYLFLHHFRHLHPILILVFLNLFIFAAMLPVVHFLFEKFTFYQLLSPLLSLLFALFYPLAILLHLIGQGSLMDSGLAWLFHTEMTRYHLAVSLPFLLVYLLSSLLAIGSRHYFYIYLTGLSGFVLAAAWQAGSMP